VKSEIRDTQAIFLVKREVQQTRQSDSHTVLKRTSDSVSRFINISSDVNKIQWIKRTQNVLSYFDKHFENVKIFRIFVKDTIKSKLRAGRHKEKIKFGESLQTSFAEYQSCHTLAQKTKITT